MSAISASRLGRRLQRQAMPDRYQRVRSGVTSAPRPCRVVLEKGAEGTGITIHVPTNADILPSDSLIIAGRTYTVTWSPAAHELDTTMQGSLMETART